jgi:putative SOS response-associated peptidase YedK
MCGRTTLFSSSEALADLFELPEPPDPGFAQPRYNIAPTQPLPIVRPELADPSRRQIVWVRWGLVPFWSEGPKASHPLINARAESVAKKPAFRNAFRRRRCLIPSNGFYEWRESHGDRGSPKQPYFVGWQGRALFAMAGLWEHWQDDNGNELESCAVLTTRSNELISPLHDRMPVILSSDYFERWLSTSEQEAADLVGLLEPIDDSAMVAYPVSRRVNDPTKDDPSLIEPIEASQQGGGGPEPGMLF